MDSPWTGLLNFTPAFGSVRIRKECALLVQADLATAALDQHSQLKAGPTLGRGSFELRTLLAGFTGSFSIFCQASMLHFQRLKTHIPGSNGPDHICCISARALDMD